MRFVSRKGLHAFFLSVLSRQTSFAGVLITSTVRVSLCSSLRMEVASLRLAIDHDLAGGTEVNNERGLGKAKEGRASSI